MFDAREKLNKPRTLIIYQRDSSESDENVLEEITLLAESAGCEVVDTITAYRSSPDKATFVGKGKVDEIKEFVHSDEIELVILNHSVSPIQERNLERKIDCRVLDRTGLILDIFAQRARTREGKLQVELAQLKHISTRLVRGWTHLERQKGGIGLRGPGETQLETDRRLIGQRIKNLHKRLEKVSAQRNLRRKSRKKVPIPTVSMVGYTNAGKSSLFNALTDANVYAEDQLFATLDTTMRRLELDQYGPIVLSDTVGFIQDLPHSLVQAFHSTLEEVSNAQLLLHIVDCAASERDQRINEVNAVLKEIDADDIPTITVFNKIDLTEKVPKRISNTHEKSNTLDERVWVSAHTGEGLGLLLTAISEHLSRDFQSYSLKLSPSDAKLRALLFSKELIQDEIIDENGSFLLTLRLSKSDLGWLKKNHPECNLTVLEYVDSNVA